MADIILPADLPENLEWDQIIAPNGSDIGMPAQYGYNYLLQQVNAAQKACMELAAENEALREELSNKTNIIQTYNAAEVTPLPNQHIQEMSEAADIVGDLTAERLELERRVGALEGMSQSGTWTPELVTDQGDEIPITNTSGRWIRTGKQIILNLGFTVGEFGEADGILAVVIPSELYLAYSAPISIGQVRVAGLDAPANYDSPFVSNISRTQFRISYHRPDGSWSGLTTKHIKAGSSFGIQVVYEGA